MASGSDLWDRSALSSKCSTPGLEQQLQSQSLESSSALYDAFASLSLVDKCAFSLSLNSAGKWPSSSLD